MTDPLLVIPTARVIPVELQAEFGRLPSAMIPINNRPALSYILDAYGTLAMEIMVVVGEESRSLHELAARKRNPKLAVIEATGSASLAETVLRALDQVDGGEKHLVLNFGDTLVRRELAWCDCVVYARKEEVYRWTTFDVKDGRLVGLTEKLHEKEDATPRNVFVGVFEIARSGDFAVRLRDAVARADDDIDPFYSALQSYLDARCDEGVVVRYEEVATWYDFGHLDTYYATRRALSSGAREFNTVTIDAKRGTLLKRSRHKAKLRNEIAWYMHVPQGLQHYSPRIFNHSLDLEDPFVEMEYYGYPTLNDVYLHGAYSVGEWELILGAIGNFVDDTHEHTLEPDEPDALLGALHEMYESKTRDRLAPVLHDDRFASFRSSFRVNGEDVMGLDAFLKSFAQVAHDCGLYASPRFTVLHGDLCLSNILFDRRNGTIRLIDPRGDFGGFDVYGDFRYDLAKLSHSLHGDYDFLVNELFDLDVADREVRLEMHYGPRHQAIKALFDRWLGRRFATEVTRIRLIESLLFLSMVPLHADRFRSQQAFLVRGLQIYSSIVRSLPVSLEGEPSRA